MPAGYSSRLYAKFSMGAQLLGDIAISKSNLHYAIYVSNGEGEHAYEKDDNQDKGFGARVIYQMDSFDKLQIENI
jgi:hypothetical protein